MFLTTHAVSGGLLATKVKNPLFSFPLIIIAHFLLDAIPHWDFGINYRRRPKIHNFILATLDGLLGLTLTFLLFQSEKTLNLTLWLGTFLSLSPDLLEFPSIFLNFHLIKPLDYFHSRVIHHKNENLFWGILPQLIIIGAIFLLA